MFCLGVMLCSMPAMVQAKVDYNIIGQVDKKVMFTISSLLRFSEENINFTHSKLYIDQTVDPSIDLFKEMRRLDSIVKEINRRWNPQTSLEKKDALRRYLYESGEWNNNQAFTYDFADPLGTKLENKLLETSA